MNTPTLTLKTLLGDYPNTRALKSGALLPAGFAFEFADVKVPNRAFKRAVRNLEFAVTELALVTYFQAKAYGKPLALIPAVVGAGRYQHHCLVYNAERERVTVAQLQGKRIGIRAHAQTTIAWVRGILADDYGMTLNRIQWVTFEDGHLAEFPDPPGFLRAPDGASMVEMLLAGELDAAIIGTDLPDDPRLKPVLPDPHAAAPAWGRAAPHGADQPHGRGRYRLVPRAAGAGARNLYPAGKVQAAGRAGDRRRPRPDALRHRAESACAEVAAQILLRPGADPARVCGGRVVRGFQPPVVIRPAMANCAKTTQ